MKSYLAVGCIVALSLAVVGCNKKESMEQAPENMSMDELGNMNQTPAAAPEAKAVDPKAAQAGAIVGTPTVKSTVSKTASPQQAAVPVAAAPVEAVPEVALPVAQSSAPVVSEAGKQNPMDVQAALKNAGFYNGKVDGKIGPMTIKAIKEFQKANKLKADGKVGKKTWEALSRHLTAAPAQQ